MAAALVIGLASLLIRPNLSGTDEFPHFKRIVTLSHGLVIPATHDAMARSHQVDSCEQAAIVIAWTKYHKNNDRSENMRFGDQFDAVACESVPPISPTAANSRAPNADVNPPTAYLPTALGYRVGTALGGITWGIFTARLLQLLGAVGLTWVALRILPRGHGLLVTVALIPAVAQINGQLSADPPSNAAAFIWIALVLRTIDEVSRSGSPPSRRRVIELAIAGVGLAITKPFLAPFLLASLAIPWAGSKLKQQAGRLATILLPAIALVAGWYFLAVSRIDIIVPIRGANSAESSQAIMHHPIDFLVAAARGLSDVSELRHALNEIVELLLYAGPSTNAAWATVMGVACVIAVVLSWRGGRGAGRFTLPFDPVRVGVIALLVIVEIVVIEYGVAISYNAPMAEKISGLQGRYLLPLIPLAYVATRPRLERGSRIQAFLSVGAIALVVAANLWSLGSAYVTYYA